MVILCVTETKGIHQEKELYLKVWKLVLINAHHIHITSAAISWDNFFFQHKNIHMSQ